MIRNGERISPILTAAQEVDELMLKVILSNQLKGGSYYGLTGTKS
jgi:hypothetical protein